MNTCLTRGFIAAGLLAACLLLAPGAALAQGTQVKPYMMIVVDTSGSMAWDTASPYNETDGDGSADYWTGGSSQCCRGVDTPVDTDLIADDSRLYQAKNALALMVNSSGDIIFGLTKFPQVVYATSPYNVADWYWGNQAASAYDRIRYDGQCTGTTAQMRVVTFSEDNANQIVDWMDHHEFTNSTTPVEWEMRADGPTPLAYTVSDVRTYYAGTVIPGDSMRACRPYFAVVVSDGDENCGGNAPLAVDQLYDIVYSGTTYHVSTYVIGYAFTSTILNQMADYGDDGLLNGSTPAAFRADSEAELAAILFEIVDGSVLNEICNGADDDCDTLVDEGFTKYCDRQGVLGPPTSSLIHCTDPGETVCDGLDDNCNGSVDEGLLNDCGTCGTLVEICDGADNDCDTIVDEGGVCSGCVPTGEICNNLDDDCDTSIDEGLTRTCGTDVGECSSGVQTCAAGVWGTCVGEIGPSLEACNCLDDDCNGVVDGFTGTCEMSPGVLDTGECEYGYRMCLCTGGVFSWTACMGGIGPTSEVCNGLDDDCDGTPDDGNPGGGAPCGTEVGVCTGGTVTCVLGTLVCTGGTGPGTEACNGLDDDCDGTADEGNPGGGAACGPITLDGIGLCEAGVITCDTTLVPPSLVCIGAVWPVTEECNGLDDDCNTLVDDGITGGAVCGTDTGECVAGLRQCIAGAWVCVGEVGPSPEVCDGLDNDCDTGIDEGNPGGGAICGTDVGECEPGVTYCDSTLVPPAIVCVGEVGPTTEVCNGLDDDCDGLTDEDLGLGDECGTGEGECETGYYICNEAGELECVFGRGPSPEVCDCLDNDCDTFTDEENPCSVGICVDCTCASPCDPTDEWGCPTGRVCMEVEGYDGYWCVGDPCEGVECPPGERCSYGECVSPCDDVVCPEGQVCSVIGGVGVCVPADCYAPGYECPECERCRAAECEPDPCCEVVCGPGEFCREGVCHEVCGPEDDCPDGQVCHDGECVEDPCWDVECTGGRVCVDGECVEDPCEGVICRPEHICVDGECIDPPCGYIICPDGFVCVDETCVDEGTVTPDETPDSETDASTAGHDILATGAGGCAGCTLAGAGASGQGLAWAIAALAISLGLMISRGVRRPRRARRCAAAVGAAVVIGIAAWGCNEVPYCIGDCDGGTDMVDTGTDGEDSADGQTDGPDADAADGTDTSTDVEEEDGGPVECVPACDTGYDCCMGMEGPECVDTSSHLNHCGECGNRCEIPHAYNACEDGVCVITGCDVNYYDCVEDDPMVASTLGCETVCFQTMTTDEVCDHIDNDCDCVADDEVDFMNDPENCGACAVECRYPNAEGVCSGGTCSMGDCLAGYHDLPPYDTTDGCEYECTECENTEPSCVTGTTCCTISGDETCNGLDDDCEGTVDEGDPGGGGTCGEDAGECVYGTLSCTAGALVCTGGTGPVAEECDGLDNDCDGSADEPDPGETYLPDEDDYCGSSTGDCEFGRTRCIGGTLECQGGVTSVPEACDGHDNDCNGLIDDGSMPGEGATCGTDLGECTFGTTDCVAGAMTCTGGYAGTVESCDDLDNDCDGLTDEDFLFLWDPSHCGDCTTVCSTTVSSHAISVCSMGSCVVAGCEENWWPGPAEGCTSGPSCCTTYCEYTGNEVCDGVDNDCDTLVDTADSSLVTVPDFCEHTGECVGAAPVCRTLSGTTGWFCSYGPTVTVASDGIHLDPEPGTITPTCDDLDNDCDGAIDEHLTLKGTACSEGTGSCRDTGVYVCNTGGSGLDCDATPGTGTAETCNGLDDDCNGTVDDFSSTDYTSIGAVLANGMYVFQYEAAKPDASSCNQGTATYDTGGVLTSRACSRSGAQPWTNVTWTDASRACQNLGTGWDLCSAANWQSICRTSSSFTYPYGNTYQANTCNGNDYDTGVPCPLPGTNPSGDQDEILNTGSMTSCYSLWGTNRVYDMSGNVKEWTSTSPTSGYYQIRGGSSNVPQGGLTCTFDFTIAAPTFSFFNVGFRCCHP